MSSDEQFPRNLGKGMITVAWLILLGLLTMLFSNFLDKENNPNKFVSSDLADNDSSIVVLKMNRAGHYVAPGKINHYPVRFLLDTGATDVAIPEELAGKLKLEKQARTMSQTANGIVRSYSTTLDSISIGNIELHNIRASIFPGMPGGEVLLGMSFLKHVEMTQKDNLLTLQK